MTLIVCPDCGTPDHIDARDLGKQVECHRCRAVFEAEAVALPPDRPAVRPDASGSAVSSLLYGVGAVVGAVCCGVGLLLALAGLFSGYRGLQSRRRGLSVFGMTLNAAALVLNLAVIVLLGIHTAAQQTEVPPKPDGTRAPFDV